MPSDSTIPSGLLGFIQELMDLEARRDRTRAQLAFSLVLLLAVVVVFGLVGTFFMFLMVLKVCDSCNAMTTGILGPVVALVGAATGFYFGSRNLSLPPPFHSLTDQPRQESEPSKGMPSDSTNPPELRRFIREVMDLEARRDRTRAHLAFALVLLLAVVVVFGLGSTYVAFGLHGIGCGPCSDMATGILGPVVALVGAATGFYFGSRNPSLPLHQPGQE